MGVCNGCSNYQRRIEIYSDYNVGCKDDFNVIPEQGRERNTTGWNEEVWDSVLEFPLDDDSKYWVDYSLTKFTHPTTLDEVYEIKGNCFAWGIDTSSWVANESVFKCDIGLTNQEVADWQSIQMLYLGSEGSHNDEIAGSWSCEDGYSDHIDNLNFEIDEVTDCKVH